MKLETLSRVCMVGLRFVDAALGTLVTEGLRVEAYPLVDRAFPKTWQLRRQGVQTPSGVFAFYDLPGMRELEFDTGDENFWNRVSASPPDVKGRFIFEVTDSLRRFHKSRLELELPIQFRPDPTQSPKPEPVQLYSVPSRTIPAGHLGVYTELHQGTNNPAPWASLKIIGSGISATGVADEKGRVLVLTPYPDPNNAVVASPPLPSWQWSVRLETASFPTPSPPSQQDDDFLELDRLPTTFTPSLTGVHLIDGLTYLDRGGRPLTAVSV